MTTKDCMPMCGHLKIDYKKPHFEYDQIVNTKPSNFKCPH